MQKMMNRPKFPELLGQIQKWILGFPIQPNLKMKMGSGHASCFTDFSNQIPPFDFLVLF